MHYLTHCLFSFMLVASLPSFSKEAVTPSEVTIGIDLKAKQYSDIYFSGQPDLKDFKELNRQGFKTIINLRTASELNVNDHKSASKAAGLNYFHIPFGPDQSLSESFVDSVTKAVVGHRKEGKVLIHCGSGNRAGMWAGAHFFKDHHFSKKDALEMSILLGIGNHGTGKLKSYLKTHADQKKE